MNIQSLLDFFLNKKLEKKTLKIRNKGNRKTNFILWNFEDQKEWNNRGKTKEIFKTNIIKEKKNPSIQKIIFLQKQSKKTQKIFLFLKKQKKKRQTQQ